MEAGDYAAARDTFSDAVELDADNAEAQLGLGVAYLRLKDFKRARQPMEKACASPAANRVAILNMVSMQLTINNPMRGVRMVMDYLKAHPQPLDEPMLNALAAAMMHAEERTRQQTLFKQAEEFYEEYNTRLEAARPGMKRWGTQWLPAADAQQKLDTWKRKLKEVARLSGLVSNLNNRIAAQQKEVKRQQALQAHGWDNTVHMAQRTLADLQRERQNRLSELADAQPTEMERPPMPTEVAMVTLDQVKPPEAGEQAVAWGGDSGHRGGADARVRRPQTGTTELADARPNANQGGNPFSTLSPPAEDSGTPADTSDEAPVEAPRPKKRIKVTQYAAAFPVSSDLLVTAAGVVEGASQIQLQSADGSSADAEVVRSENGLALLRAKGRKFMPLSLGNLFTGGAIQCAALTSVNIFQPAAKLVAGTAGPAGESWSIRMQQHPRLGGAPLLVDGKVVGVELAQRDSEASTIPAATLEQIRALLGNDLPNSVGASADPTGLVVQVIATHEKMQ
jgi:tetratricopeptide (TPR) repeat protein